MGFLDCVERGVVVNRATAIAFAGLALLGCAHGGNGGEALAVAAVAAAEVAAYAALPAPVPDPDPDPDPYIGVWAGPPSASVGSATHSDFEPAAALAAIDALDFGACRSSGTLIGWNHARLTFERDGAVSRAEIDGATLVGMPPPAVECLRGLLSTVSAPRFEGPPVTIGAAFFVP
jgi:hypothetical protein